MTYVNALKKDNTTERVSCRICQFYIVDNGHSGCLKSSLGDLEVEKMKKALSFGECADFVRAEN